MTVSQIEEARAKREANQAHQMTMQLDPGESDGMGTKVTCTFPRKFFLGLAWMMMKCAFARQDMALTWEITSEIRVIE